MAERRKKISRKAARTGGRKAAPTRWSQRVTRESDALDLKHGVFKQTSAKKIAASLKRSAEHSTRRKSGAYRSALSMLTFYINRAGKTLPKTQRERLERAKVELKRQFGRD
jgi:transcription initiation factor TFIIIB Brf1 subunit/transcription initiation factor TFIIB